MEFINALTEIAKKNSIVFSNAEADKNILIAFESYCENENDILQFQEYKNILSCNVLLANSISEGYIASKKARDKHFKALADKIEEVADELEKHNISCFSYSYFIYAFIKYFMDSFGDENLKALGIQPIRWLKAENYDLSDTYDVTDEETFGFGRYKESVKSFKFEKSTLKKYTGKAAYVIVPNFIRTIDSGAFSDNKNVRSLYLPNSVTAIKDNAFYNCENLETIVLGNQITNIPASAFEGCKKLKRINLQNIKTIGARGFKGCVSLSKVDFSTLTKVSTEAFAYCINIKNYDFISNLQTIGEEAFRECRMDYVTLKRCDKLGKNAFMKCGNIARITIESDVKFLGTTPFNGCNNVNFICIEGTIGHRVHQLFNEDVNLFNSDMRGLTCIKKNKLYDDEFEGYIYVTDIEIFDETIIPNEAFKNCTRLENVKFDKGIESIGDSAFENCKSLSSLEINYKGTSIPKKAFYKCQKLSSFSFLDNCVSFEEKSLAYDDLSNFSFNRDFVFIGAFAFANCKYPDRLSLNLEKAKVLPGAFHGVREIKTLKLSSLKNIYHHQIYWLFNESKEEFNAKSLVRYVFIKDSLEKESFKDYRNIRYVEFNVSEDEGIISNEAFKNSAIESIKVNGIVKGIDVSAFENCNKLNTLDMSYDKLKVMDYAFAKCNNVEKLISLDKITYFGNHSFESTDIVDLTLSANTKHIGKGAFARCNQITKLVLPFVGEALTTQEKGGHYFGYIFADSIDKNDNIQKVQDDGDSFEFYIPASINEVTVLSNNLSKNAFNNCYFLKKINLPEIKVLADEIFEGCQSLDTLNIGANLVEFSALSILNCPSLVNIAIDKNCNKYQSNNGSVFSKDSKTIYYLSEKANLNDYIDNITEIESGAIQHSPKSLYLHGNIVLHRYAIDGSNINDLSIDDISGCEQEAIFACNNLKALSLTGKVTDKLISCDKENLTINNLLIDGIQLNEIVSIFNEDVSLNVEDLEINNVKLSEVIFKKIDKIENLRCFMNVDSSAKGALGEIDIRNMELLCLQVPIEELFKQSTQCLNIKKIEIKSGDIVPFAFSKCSLDVLELDDVNTIKENAFAQSIIDKVIVYKINTIEKGAFLNSQIMAFNIDSVSKYQTIDSILYGERELIYCFDKTIENITIPEFANHIASGSICNMSQLKELTIKHSDIVFDNKAIVDCPNLQNLVIGTIRNKTVAEIFDNPSTISSIIFLGDRIKHKYFSKLQSLKTLKTTSENSLSYIGDMAFAEDLALESINLTNVNHIGDLAFYHCESIKDLKINDACKYIGLSAFEGCDNLSTISYSINNHQIENNYNIIDILGENNSSPVINVQAEQINDLYFEYYKNTINVLNSPKSVGDKAFILTDVNIDLISTTNIGESAFEGAFVMLADLKNIETIGDNAFKNCANLSQIKIGSKAKFIGNGWIDECPISTLVVDDSNKNFKSVDNCLVDLKNGNRLIYVAKNNSKEKIVLDSSIGIISSNAFNNSIIKEVTINGAKKIEKNALSYCHNLKSLKLENIEKIDGNILDQNNLAELIIDEINVNGSTRLSSLFASEIPNTLKQVTISKKVSEDNFDKISNIETVKLPKDLEKIPAKYFVNCHMLSNFSIPEACFAIGDEAFKGCNKLENINLKKIKYFGKEAFYGCENLTNIELPFVGKSIFEPMTLYYLFGSSCNLKDVTIKDGQIVAKCFEGQEKIKKLSLPEGITEIGESTFRGMSNLSELTGIDSVIKINDFAFENCAKLPSISLNKVKFIGKNCFNGCSKFKQISLNSSLEHIEPGVFVGCNSIQVAAVPFNEQIQKLVDYGFTSKELKKVNIITGNIQKGSFDGYQLESITLNSEIKEILPHMFENSETIAEVVMPGVTSIGDYAFSGCSSLTSITIPDSVTRIGEYVFADCKNLTSIDLKNVMVFGESAFENCSSLEKVELNNEVKVLPTKLFANAGLQHINIPTSLCEIGDEVFAETKMKDVELKMPKTLTKVGKYVFKNAYSPIVYIYKKQDKLNAWNSQWKSGCKGHGLFWANKTVKTKNL